MARDRWTAWLVERRDGGKHQWLSRGMIVPDWTEDAIEALHFVRRQDAEAMLCAEFPKEWDIHITEHMFG